MLRQADEWSLLSVISDVAATRKESGYELNSHTSVFATSWLDRCLESGHPCGCGNAADGRLSNASALAHGLGILDIYDNFATFVVGCGTL